MRHTEFLMAVYSFIWKRNMLTAVKNPILRSEMIAEMDELEAKIAQHLIDECGEDYNVYEDVIEDMGNFLNNFPDE